MTRQDKSKTIQEKGKDKDFWSVSKRNSNRKKRRKKKPPPPPCPLQQVLVVDYIDILTSLPLIV